MQNSKYENFEDKVDCYTYRMITDENVKNELLKICQEEKPLPKNVKRKGDNFYQFVRLTDEEIDVKLKIVDGNNIGNATTSLRVIKGILVFELACQIITLIMWFSMFGIIRK